MLSKGDKLPCNHIPTAHHFSIKTGRNKGDVHSGQYHIYGNQENEMRVSCLISHIFMRQEGSKPIRDCFWVHSYFTQPINWGERNHQKANEWSNKLWSGLFSKPWGGRLVTKSFIWSNDASSPSRGLEDLSLKSYDAMLSSVHMTGKS